MPVQGVQGLLQTSDMGSAHSRCVLRPTVLVPEAYKSVEVKNDSDNFVGGTQDCGYAF